MVAERDQAQRLAQARTAYLAAVHRLNHALRRFDTSGTPMDPGPDPDNPHPWTREQVQRIRAAATAFRELLDRRQAWDTLRRDLRPHRKGEIGTS
jgi:hypothetical protein